MGSTQSTWEFFPANSQRSSSGWVRARMRAVSPRSRSRCTRTASSSWTSTRTASWTRTTCAAPSTTSVSCCLRESWMDSWVRSADPAPSTTWSMFQEKMAGEGNDSDDLIIQAFKAYDMEGKIGSKMFEHALKTWGDKMTKAEIEDIFGEFEIDEDYMIKTKDVISLFVAVKEEPKAEEPVVVEEAPVEEEEDADAKKKKKKKKAAK